MSKHNFDAQSRETESTFAEFAADGDLPETADIEYQFVPMDGADWDAFEAALLTEGYGVTRFDADDEDSAMMQATLHDQPLSALSIWLGEEIATRLALEHGFEPDGWGFYAG